MLFIYYWWQLHLGNDFFVSRSGDHRIDHYLHGGRILSFIRNDIPSTFHVTVKKLVEGLYVELNIRKDKLFIGSS